jgi:3-hydroxypropanoate dehydrogenase
LNVQLIMTITTDIPAQLTHQARADVSLALDPAAQELLFRAARTANTFTDEPVSEDARRAIYDLVKWGPTAMNSQPLRIAWVTTPEAHARLVPLMAPGNQAKVAQAPVIALLAADLDFHENLPTTFPHNPGAKDAMAANEEARRRTAMMNAAIQTGYFVLAVRAAGLAAGPMAGLDTEAVAAEFFPRGRHAVIAAVNIGHPGVDAHFPRGPRLAFEDATTTH